MRFTSLTTLGIALLLSGLGPALAATPGGTPVTPPFDARNFTRSTQIDNPYSPLAPGTTFVYEGFPNGHAEHNEVEVTHDTKLILGVTCVVVHDRVWVKGVLTEDTFDWYAQDRAGNVWYMGENTSQLKNGVVVGHEGSWEAGVSGAQPGYIMEAHPQIGDLYRQEYLPGEAEDVAEVTSLTESTSSPYGSWAGNVLRTRETSALEPNVFEDKLYAPGIGFVREEVIRGGPGGSQLIDIRHN